jgi:hypothetical protein
MSKELKHVVPTSLSVIRVGGRGRMSKEELDSQAVSALSVQSRKLSVVRRGQSLDG